MHTLVVKWIRHQPIMAYTFITLLSASPVTNLMQRQLSLPALQPAVAEYLNVCQFYLAVCELFQGSLINQLANSQRGQIGVQECPRSQMGQEYLLCSDCGNGCLKPLRVLV